jgi:hypothetical protein
MLLEFEILVCGGLSSTLIESLIRRWLLENAAPIAQNTRPDNLAIRDNGEVPELAERA